jgi:hypothetical protein
MLGSRLHTAAEQGSSFWERMCGSRAFLKAVAAYQQGIADSQAEVTHLPLLRTDV